MSDNKNLKYALIGGAAIVGAAALYWLTSTSDATASASDPAAVSKKEDDDKLEEQLDAIGEIEYEDQHVKFEQFLKIFEICSYHGKTEFAEQKKNFIARRRQALKDGDEALYA
jgi:hypothetical protein